MVRIIGIPVVVLTLLLPLLLVLSAPVVAAPADPAAALDSSPVISSPGTVVSSQTSGNQSFAGSLPELLAAGVYRVGKVQINKNERSLSFPAQINLDKGLLEYLLVRTGGKTHESLFRTEAEPYDIQLACLLLNLQGSLEPLAFQGSPEQPKGDPVRLTVSLHDDQGRIREFRPELWLNKKVADKSLKVEPLQWVFAGSQINEGRFLAQVDGSVIALYHDPVAIVDNASPGGESDEIWFVNEKTVPPVGTPVTITIESVK